MLTRPAAAIVAALLALPLGACTPEGPQAAAPQTQCVLCVHCWPSLPMCAGDGLGD
jgi:hypothetical protein